MKKTLPSDFDLDMLRALQCAYYVHAISIVDDKDFDTMQKEYELINGPLPVGSDKKDDYSPAQRSLCMYFMFSGRIISSML